MLNSLGFDFVRFAKWCNICNSQPATGILWVELEDESIEGEHPLDACDECADKAFAP